jgi:acetyltransferase-like isoleucine patch superfamily enzyme
VNVIAKVRAAIARDRGMAAGALGRKIASNAAAAALAKIALRACDEVGRRPRAFGSPQIDNRGVIVIGDDFAVASRFGAATLATGVGGRLEIGNGVVINYGTFVRAASRVTLGDGVMIGPFCVVSDADVDDEARPIEIGERVWLAARVVVRPGVRIGANAVIAAGSVVENDIPANAIASGAPARVLRVRGQIPPAPISGVQTKGGIREAS